MGFDIRIHHKSVISKSKRGRSSKWISNSVFLRQITYWEPISTLSERYFPEMSLVEFYTVRYFSMHLAWPMLPNAKSHAHNVKYFFFWFRTEMPKKQNVPQARGLNLKKSWPKKYYYEIPMLFSISMAFNMGGGRTFFSHEHTMHLALAWDLTLDQRV